MSEVHIASCVVHVRPEQFDAAVATIRCDSLAEVPASDRRGRIVAVIEGPNAGAVLDRIERLRALPGVVAVNLVYQHAEDESTLTELMS